MAASASAGARLEPIACRFWVPPGERASCYDLVVPERRDRPGAPDIRLFVAVLHSLSQRPAPDPIVFLNGGPGDAAFMDDMAEAWRHDSKTFRRTRDFVVFDQRGIGLSQPLLDCPELDIIAERYSGRPISREHAVAWDRAAALACRRRLVDAGVDLSAYTTRESAADVASLVLALGLKDYNIMAVSYGTRLALAVMRHHPARLRSAVLDSVYPPGVDDYELRPWLAARAFRQLFRDCAMQPDCDRHYGDIEARFMALIEELAAMPRAFMRDDRYQSGAIHLDGVAVVEGLYSALYHAAAVPALPMIIAHAAEGDYRLLADWVGTPFSGDLVNAEAMALTIECGEVLAFSDPDRLSEQITAYSPYGLGADLALEWQICPAWGAESGIAADRRLVSSDIPALLLTGRYDPVTPPAWAHLAAEGLSRGTVLEFAAASHSVLMTEPCAERAAVAFYSNPAADLGAICPDLSQPPRFILR
jgi:pimeloyl-ACP methyl ester carboxylesterase